MSEIAALDNSQHEPDKEQLHGHAKHASGSSSIGRGDKIKERCLRFMWQATHLQHLR